MEDPEFEAFFYGQAKRIVRLAHLLGATDPEDTAQEAFCRLYAARKRLRKDPTAAVAYLNRITVNLIRSEQRRKSVAVAKAPLVAVSAHTSAEVDRVSVLGELGQLSDRQREVVVLRFWADLPLAEIAEAMGTTVGTVKSQLSRGLATLSLALGEEVQ